MADTLLIEDLRFHRDSIKTLANWHFNQWGTLTQAQSLEAYADLLKEAAAGSEIPSVLVAFRDRIPLGSVSLVVSDMSIRQSLTPWLAMLFIAPEYRDQGIGSALIRAALARTQALGFPQLNLYTSGDLPRYYEKLGWSIDERVQYLGKERTIMHYDLAPGAPGRAIT
jgi:GNAT superfamily N-acetyltransferase